MKRIVLAIATFCSLAANAQDLPATNIVMIDMKYHNGNFNFSTIKDVATKKGYENQPRFSEDGTSILYSGLTISKKGNNTDIYSYKLNGGKTRNLTNSKLTNEYSPRVTDNAQYFSCVSQDGDDNQYIAKFKADGKFDRFEKMNNDVVAYYAWFNPQNIFVNTLPDPMTLKLVNIFTNKENLLASKVGHTLEYNKRNNSIYYVDQSDSEWKIMRIKIGDKMEDPEFVVNTKPNVEDFCMMNDGSLICASEGKLYHFAPWKMGEYQGEMQKDWNMIADLGRSKYPTSVTRLAVSPNNDMLALVVSEDDDYFTKKKDKKK